MPRQYKPSGRIGPACAVTLPVGLGLVAASGFGYGAVAAVNPWGIANSAAYLAAVVAGAIGLHWMVKLGKLRSVGWGWLYGLAATGVFVGGGFVGIWRIESPGDAFMAFHSARLGTGVTMFGAGSWALAGWMLVAAWVLAILLALLVCVGVPSTHAGRPFCESCGTGAAGKRWSGKLTNPSAGGIARARSEKSLDAVLAVMPGSSGASEHHLVVRIGACRCLGMATVTAKVLEASNSTDPGTEVVEEMAVSRGDLERIEAWRARALPHSAAVPQLSIRVREHTPLEITPELPAGESHQCSVRWGGGPSMDSFADNEYTKALRKRLADGDYLAAEAAIQQMRHPSDRAYVAEACADWPERPTWLDEWIEERPDSGLAYLVSGIGRVQQGWKARGAGWVPKNYEQFQAHLRDAEAHLVRAAELLPKDPTCRAWMLYAGKGLELGIEEQRARFEEVERCCPRHRSANTFMLDSLLPKWGGSEEDSLRFAREQARSARAGSVALSVVAEAHLHVGFDKEKEAATYWAKPDVAREVREANSKLFGNNAHKENMDSPRTRSMFAYMLWKTGQTDLARPHLERLGKSTAWGPFNPIPGTSDSYGRARKAAGL